MNITFGIITFHWEKSSEYVNKIIDSIRLQAIPSYEIIVVGGPKVDEHDVKWIPFDDDAGPGRICTKKNIITKEARYDYITYGHDYIYYDRHWYWWWRNQYSWDIAVNRIVDLNENRFRDLILWDQPGVGAPWTCGECWCPPGGLQFEGSPCLPNYNYDVSHKEHLAICGTWFFAHKEFMQKYPLDENIRWGSGEDIEWSLRWRKDPNVVMQFNKQATCKLMKQKYAAFPIREDII